MHNYKRITFPTWHNTKFTNYGNNSRYYLKRLWDLENQLEQGTLLKLPCPLGQTIYKVYSKCNGSNCPYNGNYGQWRCRYKEKQQCDAFIDEVPFTFDMRDSIDKTIFLNLHEAEQKLEEIKQR